jgi:hypothetical protein
MSLSCSWDMCPISKRKRCKENPVKLSVGIVESGSRRKVIFALTAARTRRKAVSWLRPEKIGLSPCLLYGLLLRCCSRWYLGWLSDRQSRFAEQDYCCLCRASLSHICGRVWSEHDWRFSGVIFRLGNGFFLQRLLLLSSAFFERTNIRHDEVQHCTSTRT